MINKITILNYLIITIYLILPIISFKKKNYKYQLKILKIFVAVQSINTHHITLGSKLKKLNHFAHLLFKN